jgi:hypothetical protein
MADSNSLISLGELTKPATVLIEKVSDAIGGVFRPYQIKRIAKAEAEAGKIKALANIEINEIQERALDRLIQEEGKRQENIESITAQALPDLEADTRPEDIENDWLVNFFEKCRIISDKEMQSIWARMLAGEANNPGTFSKRTVQFISSMEKSDAQLFTDLCSFCWFMGTHVPFIYNENHEIYSRNSINPDALLHLDDIGLISFSISDGYRLSNIPEAVVLDYFGTRVVIEATPNYELNVGGVMLTKMGKELAPICGAIKTEGFMDYTLSKWLSFGYKVRPPFPKE